MWLVLSHGAAFALGLAFGCWYKRHDNSWSMAMKELERAIASDNLANAKEEARNLQRWILARNEQSARDEIG